MTMPIDSLEEACGKTRTFAIISHRMRGDHPDEKLLLNSGMLRTAGVVRGSKGRKAAASNWMAMEQERGIDYSLRIDYCPALACVAHLFHAVHKGNDLAAELVSSESNVNLELPFFEFL